MLVEEKKGISGGATKASLLHSRKLVRSGPEQAAAEVWSEQVFPTLTTLDSLEMLGLQKLLSFKLKPV